MSSIVLLKNHTIARAGFGGAKETVTDHKRGETVSVPFAMGQELVKDGTAEYLQKPIPKVESVEIDAQAKEIEALKKERDARAAAEASAAKEKADLEAAHAKEKADLEAKIAELQKGHKK
jgi:hypothetical protein